MIGFIIQPERGNAMLRTIGTLIAVLTVTSFPAFAGLYGEPAAIDVSVAS